MTNQKGGGVEDTVTGMVVEDDVPVFRLRGEERVAEILTEQFGAGQGHGLEFFPGAQVEEAWWVLAREGCGEVRWFDHHAEIVFMSR